MPWLFLRMVGIFSGSSGETYPHSHINPTAPMSSLLTDSGMSKPITIAPTGQL